MTPLLSSWANTMCSNSGLERERESSCLSSMEFTKLSLVAAECLTDKTEMRGSLPESETSPSRTRKMLWDHNAQPNVDLQLHDDPLPLDWERCLDLQSGRMYYFNRRTLMRSCTCPSRDQRLDLGLNISSFDRCKGDEEAMKQGCMLDSSGNNSVAMACVNCHLLVILSKSSPSCPNCKYVHSHFPPTRNQVPPLHPARTNSVETLSLLN